MKTHIRRHRRDRDMVSLDRGAPVHANGLGSTIGLVLVIGLLGVQSAAGQTSSFVTFESGQVRPVAMSPNGRSLYVVNTPDNRLEIFQINSGGLTHSFSVPVGMEPVAVAARGNNEIWVVNHLSDSVSIVRKRSGNAPPEVVRTLLVGDEPRDIVFAGPSSGRAFITTAHRGQNSPVEFDGLAVQSRADVWVFDAANPAAPLTILNLFGDTPRALAKSPSGDRVYAAVFNSGNRSTIITANKVSGNLPPPLTNADGVQAPWTSLIVQYNGTNWVDGGGQVWDDEVELTLPDYDIFTINAMAALPVEVGRISGVGTTLFNMAVNPTSGKIYTSNTEALNGVRFEGAGEFGGSTVRGHFVESRITVADGTTVMPRHLNKHIDYDSFPGSAAENAASLATPMGMRVSPDGSTLYVAAFGSSKVGVFDVAELENDSFVPSEADHIEVSGGGPTGLALDPVRNRLYVLTRFDNSISVIDLTSRSEIQHVGMHNPEPASVLAGRPFLYDARLTSSRGDSSCGGCHIFGDMDHLAWDLGDPDGTVTPNVNPLNAADPPRVDFHPMKGPMTTQSFRGMAGNGPMHWRGDRTGGHLPGGDPLDEDAAFKAFNPAFVGLVGRESELTEEEMQAFTDFVLQIKFPPNPIRALDNSLTADQAVGEDLYFNLIPGNLAVCNDCHVLDRSQGFFGTNGLTGAAFIGTPAEQATKVPQLRSVYQKIGYFRADAVGPPGLLPEQIRGFGFLHDGATDTLIRFFQTFLLFADGEEGQVQRRQMANFIFAYDSDLRAVVGQQITTGTGDSFARERAEFLFDRAMLGECDLIAKGVVNGEPRGLVLDPAGRFRTDRAADPLLPVSLLLTNDRPITFTCAPPGSGTRMGIDRDENGVLDGDELAARRGSPAADFMH